MRDSASVKVRQEGRKSCKVNAHRQNMQIPPIRITNKGETYIINRAIGSTEAKTNEINMETSQANDGNNERVHYEES